VPFAQRSTNGEVKYDQQVRIQSIEFDVRSPTRSSPRPRRRPRFRDRGWDLDQRAVRAAQHHIYVQVKLNGRARSACCATPAGQPRDARAGKAGRPRGRGRPPGPRRGREIRGRRARQGRHSAARRRQPRAAGLCGLPDGGLRTGRGCSVRRSGGLRDLQAFRRHRGLREESPHADASCGLQVPGPGHAVPFKFNEHIPQVDGRSTASPASSTSTPAVGLRSTC